MKFIKPPKERTASQKYRDHINQAVNLDKVLSIAKARDAYYPDNEGIPVIRFWFGEKNYHDWYFDKGEEIKRDAHYHLITTRTIEVSP